MDTMKLRSSELRKSVKMTWSLALNDFKSKYASSQLGVMWAFVKPIVQASVYIFVFSIIARAAPVGNIYPYAFWLLPGIIVWFFFSEGVMSGANALLEYSYLVKKVRFDIEILPTVKVLSAAIVHCFFVLFVLLFMYALYLFEGEWYVKPRLCQQKKQKPQ